MRFQNILAKNYKARLVLVGRSPLPKRKLWDTWIASHPVDDPITDKIRKITEIEILVAKFCIWTQAWMI